MITGVIQQAADEFSIAAMPVQSLGEPAIISGGSLIRRSASVFYNSLGNYMPGVYRQYVSGEVHGYAFCDITGSGFLTWVMFPRVDTSVNGAYAECVITVDDYPPVSVRVSVSHAVLGYTERMLADDQRVFDAADAMILLPPPLALGRYAGVRFRRRLQVQAGCNAVTSISAERLVAAGVVLSVGEV